jgi:hypothetical protein
LPILEAVDAMEQLHEIAAIHQSHPRYQAPESVTAVLRSVLRSAKVRPLL